MLTAGGASYFRHHNLLLSVLSHQREIEMHWKLILTSTLGIVLGITIHMIILTPQKYLQLKCVSKDNFVVL